MFEIPFASTLYKCDWLTEWLTVPMCAYVKTQKETQRMLALNWSKTIFCYTYAHTDWTLVTASHLEQNEALIIVWPSTFLSIGVYFSTFISHTFDFANELESKIIAKMMASTLLETKARPHTHATHIAFSQMGMTVIRIENRIHICKATRTQ